MSGDTELLVLRLVLLGVIFAFVLGTGLSMLRGLRVGVPRRAAPGLRGLAGARLVLEGVARTGMQPGTAFAAGGHMAIGRDPDSGILLPDPSVSGHHATIEETGDGWRIRDAGSTNGTFVEGRQVDRRGTELRGGELIQLGVVTLRFYP